MSPFTMVVPPVLPGTSGIFDAFSELSGSPNGSAVVNFTDSNVNMLPILPGPTKVGTHTFSIVDYTRSSLPFCDAGDIDNPDALCNQPREIRVSMFYPACPPEVDEDSRPVLTHKRHFAPVFEPSLVGMVSQLTLGNDTAMHNLMSQAVEDVPVCKGEYTMIMLTPAAGGQRQAYTQAASELAFLGYIVVTVDHLYISGFVELSDGTIQAVMLDDPLVASEAGNVQFDDIHILGEALTRKAELDRLPIWTEHAAIEPYFCVFGHGLGGKVADFLASYNVTCGGHLEGLLTLPFPLDKGDIDIDSDRSPAVGEHITVNDTQPLDEALSDPVRVPSTVENLTNSLLKTVQDLVYEISCRATGSCGDDTEDNTVQKRSVDSLDCCDGKESCNQDDCDRDRHYHDDYRPCDDGHCGDEIIDNCGDDCDNSCDDNQGPPSPDRPNRCNGGGQPQGDGPCNDNQGPPSPGQPNRCNSGGQPQGGNGGPIGGNGPHPSFADKYCSRRCRPGTPCDNDCGPRDGPDHFDHFPEPPCGNDCGPPRGGPNDHFDHFPGYPHRGGYRGHPHFGGFGGHRGIDECSHCQGGFGGEECSHCQGGFGGHHGDDECSHCEGGFGGEECSHCQGGFVGHHDDWDRHRSDDECSHCHGGWDKYRDDDACSHCHGSVGRHNGWEDVHEGHRWDEYDYDEDEEDDDEEEYEEDDDDEDEDDDCCGEEEDDEEDEDDEDDEEDGEDDEEDDEDDEEDEDDDEEDCEAEGPCEKDGGIVINPAVAA